MSREKRILNIVPLNANLMKANKREKQIRLVSNNKTETYKNNASQTRFDL